ncbi:hypothetical protein KI688_008155 [Linnemannia hyalina]|uniref:Zn(2)-C6 fungal-type domain-containing protein n=1 Tax=Linnemannia hyalina TaxID=64524 RepID=A0A9P8BYZ7_9FUNG|nr:hypothetical protein KI688_008155 [Linnemannia hyalina]
MGKKAAAPASNRDDRQSSESGADNDDHDHDHENDHDHDHDQDHEQDHNGSDEATPVKRKRLTQACDPCRKKKIKCDGIKPSCANCLKLNGNCTYLPSMKKRGPRQGYIELLEKRLDKMEQLLQHGPSAVDPELLDSKSLLNSHLRPGARRSSSPPVDEAEREPRKRPDPEERYFGTTSGYTKQHTEYDKQNDPGNDVIGPKYSSESTFPHKERPKKSLYGIKDEVPRKEILDHLIELFFDSIYFQLPIIHPGTFMKQYREGKVSPNLLNAMCAAVARFSNHPDVVTTPAFLAGEPFATNIRAVLVDSIDVPTVSNVQALLLLSMYEYGAARGPRAWMFGGMAVRQAQELGLNREDSSPVFYLKGDWVMRETRRRTFWACFILDIMASSSSGRPKMMDERDCEVLLPSEDHDWYEERPVVTEMLQEDHDSSSGTEHDPSSKPVEEDWESKAAARHPQSAMNPSDDTSAETKYHENPDSEAKTDESNPPKAKKQGDSHVLSSFAYLVRIVAVLAKVSQYVNRPRSKKSIPPNEQGSEFSLIDNALTAWHKSIPPHLAYSLENAKMVMDKGEGCIIVFMHVIYHTSVVLLHRPILASDKSSLPLETTFVDNSVARCSDAASKVSDVLEFVQYYKCPPRIFISAFFAYPVFTTATIHITNAFASDATVASRARRSLSIHVKILQTMKSYWSMADKFFYIIRDLYSIQSKISSSAAGLVVPQVPSSKTQAAPSTSTTNNANGSNDAAGASSEAGVVSKDVGPDGTIKLASISSFLKSDSGLIALWRRATEMQVLDEANQEQRRLSASEETVKRPVTLERKKEIDPQDKALREHREKMNALEIQEINQEFDRRWRSKLEPRTTRCPTASIRRSGEGEAAKHEAATLAEKRHQDEDSVNPKATKQTKVSKSTKTSRSAPVQRPTEDDTTAAAIQSPKESISSPSTSSTGGSDQLVQSPTTYRHSVLQQPQALQQHDSYILQPMRIQRTSGPASGATVSVPEVDVNRHLLGLFAQQHQQQEALSKSLDMLQNANIQRQQQLQMQQQQAAQMSSLAFGSPGGYPGSFLSAPLMNNQQSFSQQAAPSAPMFGLPLVYGSNFEESQAQRIQTESLGSLFDFPFPQEDISFLSNSFQVPPMMMQETMGFTNTINAGGVGGSTGGGVSGPGPHGRRMAPETGSVAAAATAATAAAVSNLSPAMSTTSSTTPLGRTLDAQSPPTDSGSLFNISPGLHSFLMADEAFTSVDSTPNNLIRYLQLHHQQELQQQELQQQQDMQPLLNQQNSLIFDDYYPWSQLSTLQQQQQPQPQQQQPQPQQQQQSPLDRLGHSRNHSN